MKKTSTIRNSASAEDILEHLNRTGKQHSLWIMAKTSLEDYAYKLSSQAENLELWDNHNLIALVSFYTSLGNQEIFISNVSVDEAHQSRGYATFLMRKFLKQARKTKGVKRIRLEVAESNHRALRLYEGFGFLESTGSSVSGNSRSLILTLEG